MFDLKPLPHREAIEYFASKGFAHELQRFHHEDHWREEHARNWVVAKAMRDDVSKAIREEMARALAEGQPLAAFQKTMAPRLQEMGWWGREVMEDPVTGEMVEAQLGSMRRLKVIFDTNMRTAHAAGHWASIQRTKKALPFLQYIQIDRPTKRHDHARFHDGIWPVDDPIWLRIYPPNGWFCGCRVLQRTEGWLRRNDRTVSPPLDLLEEPWEHKRSGETFDVPRGVTPGFDSNPGAVWLDIRNAWTKVTPDLSPEARDFQIGLVEGLRLQRLGRAVEGLVATDAAGQPAWANFATPARPSFVRFPRRDIPVGGSILHSHLTDATLSTPDLNELFETGAASITAITPGGAIWRAVRTPGELFRPAYTEFATSRLMAFRGELQDHSDGQALFQHALALFLEKRGIITYYFHTSERVRQLLLNNADLLRRLIDGNPLL